MIAAASLGAPYVEADEKAMECSFKSLEFVNAMYVGEGAKVLMPKLSKKIVIKRSLPVSSGKKRKA